VLPQARDFLDRFRPAGAPGAASRAGVPANRAAELSAELEPVLALLAETDAECGRIIAAARRDAERTAGAARQQAAALAADAHDRARAAREAAVEQALAAARAEAGAAVTAAQARAGRRRAAFATSQADELAAAAVELIRAIPDPGGRR
jgi:hypothetical protein